MGIIFLGLLGLLRPLKKLKGVGKVRSLEGGWGLLKLNWLGGIKGWNGSLFPIPGGGYSKGFFGFGLISD